ncbi:DUF445 domain-containing protein [Epilithonimonas arachidiradicis]|uniref:Uncharacterized membrane-anchored protein YjiN (DUF445 family) n=1 Tax=Epilithonimonas arachidiradicis TaxID=1617282 RepID=A0A420DCJ7_9FLAO|nr:DUF445 domain-containing protein [Epilithonimonas arachidiradicis]RKE89650.1 uncharacterized membrane-anchored protein YjiN (DUF445 family) [Epilithonimonas arachidiradicis]GGG44218.1 hypothetical protein GCM10007332_02080 [Epilithonimonas arachidiradicis]
MNDELKKQQLKRYKTLATGLFILMAVTFVSMTILQKGNHLHWIGYIRAFSEAAMVGALADWFAVTALFNYPLGLKIPHTNLIENSKEKIGDNLGNFVVDNFLSPQNIRPYIQKLKVSVYVGDWLSKDKNQNLLINELSSILKDIINKLDDESVVKFISNKAEEMTDSIQLNSVIGNGIEYLLNKNDHQKIITNLSSQIKKYILENQQMISERVGKESFFLIPKSVDNKIAEKITKGLSDYFLEVEENPSHPLRSEITNKILDFSKELKEESKWKTEFDSIKTDFLQSDKIKQYASDIWQSLKLSLMKELSEEDSKLKSYVKKNIDEFVSNLQNDENFQNRIDNWVRLTAYKYILKNTQNFGELISTTVGNWEGKELSRKLELEVGKDLQFIRINGTIVGGLVGLLIYTIANFI